MISNWCSTWTVWPTCISGTRSHFKTGVWSPWQRSAGWFEGRWLSLLNFLHAAVCASVGALLPSGVQVKQQSVPACGWLLPQRNVPQQCAYWVSVTQVFFYNPLNYIQRKAIWTTSHWQAFQRPPQPAWEGKQGQWHCWCICCFIHLLLNYSGLFIGIWRIIEKLRVFPYL